MHKVARTARKGDKSRAEIVVAPQENTVLQGRAKRQIKSEHGASSVLGGDTETGTLEEPVFQDSETMDGIGVIEKKQGHRLKLNVFIADSSRMHCQAMTAAFRNGRYGFTVAGYAMDLASLRTAFNHTKVDVALVSPCLRDGPIAGISAAREMRLSHPHTNVVMMLDSMERPLVVEAFRAGARGIVCREDPLESLCRCIRVVHSGQVWANSQELLFVLDALVATKSAVPTEARGLKGPTSLTTREEAVVQLVAQGLTNREISRALNLSQNTIRNYLFRIFNKVGTSTRLELAMYAVSRKQADGSRSGALLQAESAEVAS